MRYAIETKDEEGLIGIQLSKWQKEGKLEILEKSETLIELEAQLVRVAKALEILNKAGYNSAVMKSWIQTKTKLGAGSINLILNSQEEFYRQIGLIKK